MITHIVLFQLKKDIDPAVREQVMNDFRRGILSLPASIPYIRQISVGFNINPEEKWDICLNSSFDTLADVHQYSIHPKHVATAGALKQYLVDRSCVDYEVVTENRDF